MPLGEIIGVGEACARTYDRVPGEANGGGSGAMMRGG